MVTINTTDDLLRVLAENPEWKAAVRREILTEELMALPARFDRFVETQGRVNEEQSQFNADQRKVNEEQSQFNADQRRFNAEQLQFNADQRRFNAEQLQFNARVDQFMVRTDARFDRLEGDIANFRSDYARSNAIREADAIAGDMGFSLVRALSYADLRNMHQHADTSGIETRLLQSFRRADLVMEVLDDHGANHFVAVEVSYTADERDTGRALRNAGFLERFTGRPAHAAIVSVRNTAEVQSAISTGQVHWHRLENRDPDTE